MQVNGAVIIGAGPAGMAAAIQLRRYGYEPLVLEKSVIGGLLNNANLVENYPGFPAGIEGPVLVQLMKEHVQQLGVEIRSDEVFMQGLGVDPEAALAGALTAATKRGVLLRANDEKDPVFLLNTPKGKAAHQGLGEGRWNPDAFSSQAVTLGEKARNPSACSNCCATLTSRSRVAPGSGVNDTRMVSPMPWLSRMASAALEAITPGSPMPASVRPRCSA